MPSTYITDITHITVVETEKYAFGCMGRCGSTTMLKRSKKERIRCSKSFEYWNELDKEKYIILRNPITRWYSAENSGMGIDKYHALPYMHMIDWGKVAGIIPFEHFSDYISRTKGGKEVRYKGNIPSSQLQHELTLYHIMRKNKPVLMTDKFKEIIKEWDY